MRRLLWTLFGATLLCASLAAQDPPAVPPAAKPAPRIAQVQPRIAPGVDKAADKPKARAGKVAAKADALPPGAVARLGTVHGRRGLSSDGVMTTVTAVAYSPDGQTVATADAEVHLW